MTETPDLLAAARRLAARVDAHLDEAGAIRADLATFVRMVEDSIPKAADGTPIPPIMLEAARNAVEMMLVAGMTPSKTAVIQQLRLQRFSIGKDMEPVIWRHVAPMVDAPSSEADGSEVDEAAEKLSSFLSGEGAQAAAFADLTAFAGSVDDPSQAA